MVVTVPVLALRWGWLLASHGIHERVPWLTRAYFVAYTAGQVLPTVARRRRGAGRRDRAPASGADDGHHGNRAARAWARWSRDRSRSVRSASCSRVGRVRRERVPVARGRLRVRDARARVPVLRALRPTAAAPGRAAARTVPAREAAALRSTRASTTSRSRPRLLGKVLARDVRRRRRSGSSRSGRQRGRSASTSTRGSTTSSARSLPRDARAVHAERPRRARGVLRELPRERRRRLRTRPSPRASCTSS